MARETNPPRRAGRDIDMTARVLAAIPKDFKPFAALIMPVLSDMIAREGWDPIRRFLFAYRGADRSWDRRLYRNMTVIQRTKWRRLMSEKRIKELGELKALRIYGTELRRLLIQRVMTTAIEILLGAL